MSERKPYEKPTLEYIGSMIGQTGGFRRGGDCDFNGGFEGSNPVFTFRPR
jgi:hypothetical protein